MARHRFAALTVAVVAQVALASAPALAATQQPQQPMTALKSVTFNRINTIRVAFGLQSGLNTTAYNSEVLNAVASNEDPPFAPTGGGVVGEESLWGILPGSPAVSTSALALVNAWVYHDGWDGSVQATWNADCTSANASGCNGHRRALLSASPVPGAKLYIDVTTASVNASGVPSLAVAALMVWKMSPPTAPQTS